MFKRNKKEEVTYTIWENSSPVYVNVGFGEYCTYMEEMLPYFIRVQEGVAMIQVTGEDGHVFAVFEFFHIDGKDYQYRNMPDIPAEEQGVKFGVTRL